MRAVSRGITLSVPVVLAVTQPCRADFDQSGAVGVQDIFEFVAAFFAGCPKSPPPSAPARDSRGTDPADDS